MSSYDVVIVGGGAAGCVVAARLSEHPDRRVLLLEAGPDLRAAPPDDVRSGWQPTRSFDWAFASEPDEVDVARALPRGRLLGGCSSTNATCALRGSPADYDDWAARGNHGWSFDDVLPYFVRLERDLDFGDAPWHGSEGPVPIRRYRGEELTPIAEAALAAFDASGLPSIDDHNEPGAVGAGPLPVNCLDGTRMSSALTYLPADGERPNLTLRCDAQVHELLFDADRATGVRLTSGETVAAGAVVVSAGAYASPALLLRSGIGPAAELASLGIPVLVDRPGVGTNLADHPAVSISLPYARDVQPAPLFQAVATRHSSLASDGEAPDLQLVVFGPYPATPEAPATFSVAAALLKLRSRGRVTLRSADPLAPPRIELGYFREPSDLDRLAEGVEHAEELASHDAIRALATNVPELPEPRRDWMRRNAWTYHHPTGTCAMGPESYADAVVNTSGRVHGVEDLYVVDASVMPDIPSANTHVPTLMVAERLSALLERQLDDGH
jgi:choline dehydrogenase